MTVRALSQHVCRQCRQWSAMNSYRTIRPFYSSVGQWMQLEFFLKIYFHSANICCIKFLSFHVLKVILLHTTFNLFMILGSRNICNTFDIDNFVFKPFHQRWEHHSLSIICSVSLTSIYSYKHWWSVKPYITPITNALLARFVGIIAEPETLVFCL